MEVLGWLWWIVIKLVSLVWSIVWFLLGGWVATLAQLAIIVGVIFSYKYGWRRAPIEIAQKARLFGGFVWAWMRSKEYAAAAAGPASTRVEVRERIRTVRRKEPGDINVSTMLSVAALIGLGLFALI